MTPEKKQEINRVIAEAMGSEILELGGIYYTLGADIFDPVDSISDALDAVDVICVSDTVPFQYVVTINKMSDGTFKATITTYTSKKEYGFSETKGMGQTRPAAVSLALYEKIKEK